MTRTVNVTVRGVVLTVTGDYTPYTPARVRADPDDSCDAEGGTFEVAAVDCSGQDITELVDYRMDEIAEAAAEVAALDEGEAEDEE
jgi:hypothetical protein